MVFKATGLSAAAIDVTNREIAALKEAARTPGGWGFFRRATTERLAAMGYFEKADHPGLGKQWRLTEAGRAAYEALQE